MSTTRKVYRHIYIHVDTLYICVHVYDVYVYARIQIYVYTQGCTYQRVCAYVDVHESIG